MTFFVYIIYSSTREAYYIGHTDNLIRRLEIHNSGRNKSTRSGAPWVIRYTESYLSRSEAMKRELEIKRKKSRKYIEWLISQN